MSITLEQALEMGLVPYKDDRHFCADCVYYKQRTWQSKCQKGEIQYPSTLNRCNMFKEKVLQQTNEVFWEVQEKPFWEI